MWVPRRIEQFIEGVIARLGAIEQAIKETKASADNTEESTYVRRSDISRISAVVIHPDEENEATRFDREQTHREQQHIIASQNRTAAWTRNACIAAIIYGLFAAGQDYLIWKSTKAAISANETAQKALKQSSDQFERIQSALIVANVRFDPGAIQDERPQANLPPPSVNIDVINVGNGNATDVGYSFQIIERKLHTEEPIQFIGNEQRIEMDRPLLPHLVGNPFGLSEFQMYQDHRQIFLKLSERDMILLRNTNAFLEFKGTVSYFNGFRVVPNTALCYRMVGFAAVPPTIPYPEFVTSECGSFPATYQSVLNHRKDEKHQFEQSQQNQQKH
jgi:hypothetical protein